MYVAAPSRTCLYNSLLKFGKQIQKQQLEIPEYAASFVDYKALKKLIKELKNSPVTRAGSLVGHETTPHDPQLVLQANKAPFFFRLDRELDKVNAFYTIKEAESKVRLRVLTDKQRSMRMRNPVISKNSTHYITLEQGFRDFIKDLSKLQQFIEINATAFSKILKKWDKTSRSQTKELYLSRAVEVQPVFNRDVISELSDQAATSLLDCAAWAEGEGTQYGSTVSDSQILATPRLEQNEADSDLIDALYKGDMPALRDLLSHLNASHDATERITKAFLTAVSQAPEEPLKLLLATGLVDLNRRDEINDRNCLHKSAMSGRLVFVRAALNGHVDAAQIDAYGRIPLHYAAMNGHEAVIDDLVHALPSALDVQDLDSFTPLIHAIVHSHVHCVEKILSFAARIDPINEQGHIPLNLACQQGSVAVVELLLRNKPQIIPDAEGLYPQHLVARFGGDARLLLLLRDYGADLDQPDKLYQWTPLFHAASEGKVECLKTLLGCGVKTDVKDEKGQPALYYATWEGHLQCMSLLASTTQASAAPQKSVAEPPKLSASTAPSATGSNLEQIPDLSLPPPIIPTRRYGHNFLETKSTVLIFFGEANKSAVTFYDESKYPAARLTIAPKAADILPRNLLLPIQEENRSLSFEMDNLEAFGLDFDVYPTFGKKVIAKGSVPPDVFRSRNSSSGYHHLSLLDPRLRPVGQMSFKFQVIRPFSGLALDVTPFATYWKATSQLESKPSSLVTGSSLSGEYIRIPVQISRDGVPIVYPHWKLDHAGLEVPVLHLTHQQFASIGSQRISERNIRDSLQDSLAEHDFARVHELLGTSFWSLKEVLQTLPTQVHVELHILYPSGIQEKALGLAPTSNINNFVDSLLHVVFQHARESREHAQKQMRSIVFTSYNPDLCTALNWKQPNYPVVLCNDLGTSTRPAPNGESSSQGPSSSGTAAPHMSLSIKEAVRIARTNNFMGLACRAQLLNLVPALVEAIKEAGLVLVSDASDEPRPTGIAAVSPFHGVPEGVDGVLRDNGVLRFNEAIDM